MKVIAGITVRVGKTLRDWLPDAMLIAGAASVAYGAGLIYAPAGFVVGGVLLLAGGYLAARAG